MPVSKDQDGEEMAEASTKPHYPRGVRKYRSIEEMNADDNRYKAAKGTEKPTAPDSDRSEEPNG